MRIPLTLLLCRETGGMAVPLARVDDLGLLRIVRNAAVRAKREEAGRTSSSFMRRRLELEAAEIERAGCSERTI
jgi:hypothetical protein